MTYNKHSVCLPSKIKALKISWYVSDIVTVFIHYRMLFLQDLYEAVSINVLTDKKVEA